MKFDPAIAKRLADASALAYKKATVQAQRTDTQALVIKDVDAVIVAFRGSSSIRDWLMDGRFWQQRTWGGSVHAGFNSALNDILFQLFQATRQAIIPAGPAPVPIFITGHSLGGSIAQIYAEVCIRQGLNVQGVYTFGAPRVGDTNFCRHYNTLLGDRTFNVVNEYDVVPHLPLVGFLLKYWRTKSEVLLPDDGKPPVIGRSLMNHICTDGLMLYHASLLLRNPLRLWSEVSEHHNLATYQGRLAFV